MNVAVEEVLLILALAVVVYLVRDVFRDRSALAAARRRQEFVEKEREREERAEQVTRGTVARRLLAAGMPFGPIGYLILNVVLVALVLLLFIWIPGSWVSALLVAAVMVLLVWSVIGAVARYRARTFEEKLVDGVDVMVSALFAGEGLEASLRSAAEVSVPAVARELKEVGDRLELGMEMEQAVRRRAESRDSEGVRLFTRTLVAKSQSGGDLAPVLKSVAQIMRDRLRMRLRMQAQMAGARMAAVMIALMPYLLLPVFLWRRPDWLARLFGHPAGVQLFIAAILLQVIGFLWLRRLMRVEVTS